MTLKLFENLNSFHVYAVCEFRKLMKRETALTEYQVELWN